MSADETAVVQRAIQISMPGGMCDALLYSPQTARKSPGVLFLPDIGGVREANQGMAKRLAGEGYAVLLPNPFYRTARAAEVWPFERSHGEQRTKDRMAEITGPLTPEARAADAVGYIDGLKALPETGPGKVGIVGHCFTGAMAFRGPASKPDDVAVAASFHGGGLYREDDPKSPYHLLPQIKARLYFGHASNDNGMNAEQIAGLERALAAWGGRYESETYNAAHGWTVPDSKAYNREEAEKAWAKLTSVFAEELKG